METGFRILLLILKIVHFFLRPYYWYQSTKKKITVPAANNPLLRISATKLARKIRRKELTSLQVVSAYVNRIKEVNPILNAVVEDRFHAALKEAAAADELVNSGKFSENELERTKPLLGVPITVKESCSLEGCSFAVGSLPRVGIKAVSDGVAVSNLRNSGAIPLAVTNTPEYCYALETTNFVTGTTNNPYDTRRTSGGSSGGEGALIAAEASVAGIGSDVAGSIRVPAFWNGIFGHKPTAGIVSIKGHFPNSSDEKFGQNLVLGPLTRYAEDLKLMTNIMAGENAQKLRLEEEVPLKELIIVYLEEIEEPRNISPVDEDIKAAIRKCAEHFKTICTTAPRRYHFSGLEETLEIGCGALLTMKDVPNLLQNPKDPKGTTSLFSEIVKCLLRKSVFSFHGLNFLFMMETKLYMSQKCIKECEEKLAGLKLRLKRALLDTGVFLYPTLPTKAHLHNEGALYITGSRYTMIFNALGFPATHVTLGLGKDGLPVGIQVVAAPNQDRLCFAVAEELERQFGGWVPVPAK